MKKIFITGAGGYIGSNLAKFLSKKNIETVCLTTKKKYVLKNSKWLVGKLNGNYQKEFKDVDLIVHCAAAGVYKKENHKKIYKVNYYDSLEFFKKAFKAGCKNWIIIGTSGEYGFVKNKPMSVKKTKLKPVNVYGKSKVLFFKMLKNLKISKKCKILYLRVFNVYGTREPKSRLYSGLLTAVKKNLNYKMTSGEEIRDFISIRFVVKKIYKSLKLFNRRNFFIVKHIAKGKPVTVKAFAKYHWKKQKSKKMLLFGHIKKKNIYHTMYSDNISLLK